MLTAAEKTAWIRIRYFEYAGFDLEKPFADNNRLVEEMHKADWKRWRRDFGGDTTGRNRLFNLYTFVSAASSFIAPY